MTEQNSKYPTIKVVLLLTLFASLLPAILHSFLNIFALLALTHGDISDRELLRMLIGFMAICTLLYFLPALIISLIAIRFKLTKSDEHLYLIALAGAATYCLYLLLFFIIINESNLSVYLGHIGIFGFFCALIAAKLSLPKKQTEYNIKT